MPKAFASAGWLISLIVVCALAFMRYVHIYMVQMVYLSRNVLLQVYCYFYGLVQISVPLNITELANIRPVSYYRGKYLHGCYFWSQSFQIT